MKDKCQEALGYFIRWLNPIEEDFNQETYRKHRNNLQDLIDQNKPLTLDECIKEWEERGWSCRKNEYYNWFLFTKGYDEICFDYKRINYECENTFKIDLELHNLIGKTLKALEVTNNE